MSNFIKRFRITSGAGIPTRRKETTMRPVALIIRDGWGINEKTEGNAVAAARTPNITAYKAKYPWTVLDACGEAVGLPAGYQGSSEVGHLNMGAGRVVIQELKRIDDGLSSGELFETTKWVRFMDAWKAGGGRLHLLGLLLTPLLGLDEPVPVLSGPHRAASTASPPVLAGWAQPWFAALRTGRAQLATAVHLLRLTGSRGRRLLTGGGVAGTTHHLVKLAVSVTLGGHFH